MGTYIDESTKRISIGDWSTSAERIEVDPWGSLRGFFRLRADVTVELSEDLDGTLWVILWRGNPADQIGLAVIADRSGAPRGIADIPLCSCGERGCGNAGVQIWTQMDPEAIAPVLLFLRNLPELEDTPQRGHSWFADQGEVLGVSDLQRLTQ